MELYPPQPDDRLVHFLCCAVDRFGTAVCVCSYAWSLFINLFNLPLLALMFVGQLVYKMFRCPEFPRASILQAVQAFTKDASLSKSA
jgi:hypothetical protein